uniref:sensor histidine kinase n=1 Tax=Paractinoplanes polyasparticus TaxID=2856853 RepID=UPI0027DF63CA|nr:HAMP domain-containing sensor histidine kinase [Actinoplanes polyasparticus]
MVRLLATSTLVAICATVGTSWLAVQTTTRVIQQEQGRSLEDDNAVYETLMGYATTYPDWKGVGPMVARLADRTGSRITLLTSNRRLIADSDLRLPTPNGPPTAVIDPLEPNDEQQLDPRIVGPYRLPTGERDALRRKATAVVDCMARDGVRAEIVPSPSGRTEVRILSADPKRSDLNCGIINVGAPTTTEEKALADLSRRVARCLGLPAPGATAFWLPNFEVAMDSFDRTHASEAEIRACVMLSRQDQLRRYAAPPALLYVSDPIAGNSRPEAFTLSRPNIVRIVVVTGGVLAVTVAFTVFVGLRLTRPLRALTDAAGAPIDTPTPMPVTGRDEIGRLATVLNDLSARRFSAEQQRKAMINDIAHELRNPMTNIRSLLEAAEDGVNPTDARLVALLLDETGQLSRIVDDLRDLAAADAGTLRLYPEPVRLGDVLGPAAEAHSRKAESAGLRLITTFDPVLPVTVDPVRMRQVVGNLLSNAVRHTPPGGTVTLRGEVIGEQLVITTTDTGTGIAPDDLAHIFDRFWRADGSRQRATGGSGLGLAIVRDLMRAHGGTVDAASTLGQGTTVTVRVPGQADADDALFTDMS